MTKLTQRGQAGVTTDLEIRRRARILLRTDGHDAVTLRAIARALGITAPALYRYYDSREDLLRQLCDDICADLSHELARRVQHVAPDAFAERVTETCRGLRTWAVAHPREFTLVFATPPSADAQSPTVGQDEFAGVFLSLAGPLLVEGTAMTPARPVPGEFLSTVEHHRTALAEACVAHGLDLAPEDIRAGHVYALLQWWIRIYGHIALEVFGRFPFDVRHAEVLFEVLLTDLVHDIELS
ncbi:TetR family transcriptional regulator [Allosaccharopolyspora coralli]|uniref:TetR family transcriptional regulator n=1 Tax=Allosaccharopolyspora coralli TaxID=2665642 RepID=A0A5Q3QBZ7_9PSEU|nr:TetR/AcrR family transcriptional regulator [Allosaccharopolyspora coralli]QGK71883.1 TetR family transcriptional regulator [Allosaccharopolyspora coralli]